MYVHAMPDLRIAGGRLGDSLPTKFAQQNEAPKPQLFSSFYLSHFRQSVRGYHSHFLLSSSSASRMLWSKERSRASISFRAFPVRSSASR